MNIYLKLYIIQLINNKKKIDDKVVNYTFNKCLG